jgi:hypothetical protein
MAVFPELCDELAVADRAVAEGQERIGRQAEVVCQLHAGGHDTTDAQNLLLVMHAQRQEIVQELAYAQDEDL